MRFNRRVMKAKLNTWAISDFLAPRAYITLGLASLWWHGAYNILHKISFLSFKGGSQTVTPRYELISMLLSHTENGKLKRRTKSEHEVAYTFTLWYSGL
jgi:hypothetical protein